MENVLGKWQIVRLMVIQKSGRQVVKKYDDGDYTWEFLPDRTLIERLYDLPPRYLEYHYDPGVLLIQRPKSMEIYHADFLSEDELILSDIPSRAVIEVARI